MALIKCPVCDHAVAADAARCPACGHPLLRRRRLRRATYALVALALISPVVWYGYDRAKERARWEKLVRESNELAEQVARNTDARRMAYKITGTLEQPKLVASATRATGTVAYQPRSAVETRFLLVDCVARNGAGAAIGDQAVKHTGPVGPKGIELPFDFTTSAEPARVECAIRIEAPF